MLFNKRVLYYGGNATKKFYFYVTSHFKVEFISNRNKFINGSDKIQFIIPKNQVSISTNRGIVPI